MISSRREVLSGIAALLVIAGTSANSAGRHRSATSPFVGVWKYDDETVTNFLKITDAGNGRFRLAVGSEYQGTVYWPPLHVASADGIYLRRQRGKLVATFDSNNFRATHSQELTYVITCTMTPTGGMVYTVKYGVVAENHLATKVQ